MYLILLKMTTDLPVKHPPQEHTGQKTLTVAYPPQWLTGHNNYINNMAIAIGLIAFITQFTSHMLLTWPKVGTLAKI